MITVVGTPLVVGSLAHLYPHAFFNVLVLVPTVMWSMYLLYTGLPVVLMSGYPQSVPFDSSLGELRAPFLQKPFLPEQLVDRVRSVLGP